jgi:hypothetical protein
LKSIEQMSDDDSDLDPLLLRLRSALHDNDVDGVRNAINENVDLHAVMRFDRESEQPTLTPLKLSMYSSPSITAMLLRAGADPDQVVTAYAVSSSALALALDLDGCDDHITLLLAAGADPNAEINGESMLYIAFRSDCWPLLFAAGAVWNERFLPRGDDLKHRLVACLLNPMAAKRELQLTALGQCRGRMLEICIALQDLELPAPVTIEILECACAPFALRLPFHNLWDVVTGVKHFPRSPQASVKSSSPSSKEIVKVKSNNVFAVADVVDNFKVVNEARSKRQLVLEEATLQWKAPRGVPRDVEIMELRSLGLGGLSDARAMFDEVLAASCVGRGA